jgi:hypothetical protein
VKRKTLRHLLIILLVVIISLWLSAGVALASMVWSG